ncbi:MAG: DUF1801 domain-containing protein [Chryseolinea sp.]
MEEKVKLKTIEEYLSSFPEEVVIILEKLRGIIHTIAPKAEEAIGYNIGSFKLNGSVVMYYAGWKRHISIYPVPAGNAAFKKAISVYMSGKSTLKFPIDEPIPWELIAATIRFSISHNLKRVKAKAQKQRKK